MWQFLSENISNFGESVCFVCSSTPGASRQNHHHYHHCCIDKKTKIRCIGSYGKVAMLHLSSQHSWTNEYRDQIVSRAVFKKNIRIENIELKNKNPEVSPKTQRHKDSLNPDQCCIDTDKPRPGLELVLRLRYMIWSGNLLERRARWSWL